MSHSGASVLTEYDEQLPMSRRFNCRTGVATASITTAEYRSVEEERSFEAMYQRLGWHKGPYASRESSAVCEAWWRDRGEDAARWLVSRIREETNADILDAIANTLADIGSASLCPILESLEETIPTDIAETLLTTLKWLPMTSDEQADRLRKIVTSYLDSECPELREAAIGATNFLPVCYVLETLRNALEREVDEDVRDVIHEALDTRAG